MEGVSVSPNVQSKLLPTPVLICSVLFCSAVRCFQSFVFVPEHQGFHWPVCDHIDLLATKMQMRGFYTLNIN